MAEHPIDLPYRLSLLGTQIYNACQLGGWCFRLSDKHLFYSTFPYEQEFKLFLEASGTLDRAAALADRNTPVILSDPLGLLWISEAAALYENNAPLLFLLGPIFLTNVSNKYVLERMARFQTSPAVQGRNARILQEVPVLDIGMVRQYAKMLHSTIVDEYAPSIEIVFDAPQPAEQVPSSAGTRTDYLRAYQLEQDILNGIREGRDDVMEHRSFFGVLHQFRTNDPLREVKNNIIIFVSLCARAAVEGGVSLQTSKEMEEAYVSRVEQSGTISGLADLNHEMIRGFAQQVAQCKKNPNVSETIQRCCNYIRSHYMEPLGLSDISAALGYADYYLSRKFYKEMGLYLSDYINEVRLGHAKTMLATTNMSLEAISEKLNYSSRNYFSKVFRKHFGISPSEYRAGRSTPNADQRR